MNQPEHDPAPFAVQRYGPFEDLPKDDKGQALMWGAWPNDGVKRPVVLKRLTDLKDEMELHGPDQEWVVKRMRLTEEEFLDLREHPGF